MKFISFLLNKEAKFGILNNKSITDLTDKISGANTLKDLIANKGILEAKKFASKNPGNIVLDDIVSYYPYSIPEGERADHTARKVYGDVKYTWLIFLINQIHDPIFDWPLGIREFNEYIKRKKTINYIKYKSKV